MSVFPIIYYPDARLKTPCEPVDTSGRAFENDVRNLWDTMNAGPPRTVGIAAPQIGIMKRICIVDASRNPKYPPGNGLLILINPIITAHHGEQTFREGCLSLPEYTGNVRRWQAITVEATTPDNEPLTLSSEGFEAVVLQHEIDHLDGILFLDRITNVKTDLFRRKAKG